MNTIRFFCLLGTALCVLCLSPAFSGVAQEPPTLINVKDAAVLQQALLAAESDIAGQPDNAKARVQAGIAAHQLALLLGKDYADKAVEHLAFALEKDPDNALLMAYLGSSYALQVRDGGAILQRVSNVNKSLDLLNEAVKIAPENCAVRMVRGSVLFELPGMFRDNEQAIADFLQTERCVGTKASFADADLQAEIYYKLGHLSGHEGDKAMQTRYFAKALAVAPNSKWAELTKKE